VDRWLLHDVRVLDETGGFTGPLDVTVADGVITGVGANLADDEALYLKVRIGDAVRIAKVLGRIQPGYLFDAVILDQDPGDPAIFERPGVVTGVFKSGALVVRHPQIHALTGQIHIEP